jgi:hypothetical protein
MGATSGIKIICMILCYFLVCMEIFHIIVENDEFFSYYEMINIASMFFIFVANVASSLLHSCKKEEMI